MRNRVPVSFAGLLLAALLAASCGRSRPLDASDLRGLSKDQLQQQREAILERHAGGKPLSARETAQVERLREQERRLENAWIFGQWQERHGTRLLFRDDGTVSVGARSGEYDEVGVYRFISPEIPAFESFWRLVYDAAGDPVAVIDRPGGADYLYPFHRSRTAVYEQAGDLLESAATGFYFTKIQ